MMGMITELDIEADIRSVHVNKVNFMTSRSLLAIVNVWLTMFKEKTVSKTTSQVTTTPEPPSL